MVGTAQARLCPPYVLVWRFTDLTFHVHALMREQPSLALKPAAIFDQRAVGADQAMARHDDAERIRAVGMAERAHRLWHAELCRQCAIGHGRSRRYLRQARPDLALERCAGHAPFNRLQSSEIAL